MIVLANGIAHGCGSCGEVVKIVGEELNASAECVGPMVELVHVTSVGDGDDFVELRQIALIDAGDGKASGLHGLLEEVGIDFVAHFQMKSFGLGA